MNKSFKVLFVDDNKDILDDYSDYLYDEGYKVDTFQEIDNAINALSTGQYAVAIIDMDFPKEPEGGIRIVNHIKEKKINTKPIIFTGKGSIDNFRKIFTDIYDYIEKGENAIDDLLKRLENALELKQLESKRKSEKKINEKKTPIYQSVHTFEKCYNIPTRNICYRLKRRVPMRYQEAHDLIDMIDNSIGLWSDQFSMELYDPRTKAVQTQQSINTIGSFQWKEFKDEFQQYIEQNFIMNINDLFDHFTNEDFYHGRYIVTLSDIYNKEFNEEFQWDKFILFQFEGDDISVLGVRPYFRAIMINLLTNAVEAMDLYSAFKNNKKAQINISCHQSDLNTTITLSNTGIPMTEERVKFYNTEIFALAKEGKLQLSNETLENNIRDKCFTSKPGIGSGYALIHAAHYFSRIESKKNDQVLERGHMKVETKGDQTSFIITLPFGKDNETKDIEKDIKEYETCFRWQRSEEDHSDYEGTPLKPDNNLCDYTQSLDTIDKVEKDKEVLIIEDSRPDRFRMRMIINDLNIRYRRFAWDAQQRQVLSVKTIEALMHKTHPNIIILDLAWTPLDEKNIHDMLFETKDSIKEILQTIKLPNSFKLLKTIKENPDDYKYLDLIIIMSQFVPPISDGLKLFIQEEYLDDIPCKNRILHKWQQEHDFKEILIENHRSRA